MSSLKSIVLDVLINDLEGVNVEQLYVSVNKIKSCSLGSLYRLLLEMRKEGLIRKTEFSQQKAIYVIAEKRLNCRIGCIHTNESILCEDKEVLESFEKFLDKYKHEFSGMDVVLYSKNS